MARKPPLRVGDGAEGRLGDGECGGLVGVEGNGTVQNDWMTANGGEPRSLTQRWLSGVCVPWSRLDVLCPYCMFATLTCMRRRWYDLVKGIGGDGVAS